MLCLCLAGIIPTLALAAPARAEAIAARDTLAPPPGRDAKTAARIHGLVYPTGAFHVERDPAPHPYFDRLVRFPSPHPAGEPALDTVTMEWRYARHGGEPIAGGAPAVVVIHSIQPGMLVGRTVAHQLADRGRHAFVLQLPGYGSRLPDAARWSPVRAMERGRQAVADARRARDAVAALPGIADEGVTLVGISLGGYVAATAAALEPAAWSEVYLVASGADVMTVLTHGERDAARMARRLALAGYRTNTLRLLVDDVEPTPLLHRLDPQRTHLIRPIHDRVVPPASYDALIHAAELPASNVHRWEANHYTLMLHLPRLIDLVAPRPD